MPKVSIAEQAHPAEAGAGEPVNCQTAAESSSPQHKHENGPNDVHFPDRRQGESEEGSCKGDTVHEANDKSGYIEGRHAAPTAMSGEATDESGKQPRSKDRQKAEDSDAVHASRLQEDPSSTSGPSNAPQAEHDRAADSQQAEPSGRSTSQVILLHWLRELRSLSATIVSAHSI